MEQPVTMGVMGLKCDNLGCMYEDDSVSLENYPDYVNKPCPECGDNLLTQEDYDAVLMLLGIVDTINVSFDGIALEDLGEEVRLRVKMKGDGSVEFEDEESL